MIHLTAGLVRAAYGDGIVVTWRIWGSADSVGGRGIWDLGMACTIGFTDAEKQ